MAEIAEQNRMPSIQLVESGGADLRTQAEGFIPGGETFRNITRLSAHGHPDGVAGVRQLHRRRRVRARHVATTTSSSKERAKVFLGGPPLVKMATGEVSEDEELGGADMHARVRGLADYLANDEYDAIRLGREVVRRLNWRKHGPGPTESPDPPVHDPDELLGIVPPDLKAPFDPREVIARVVDGSRYDEFKALYGPLADHRLGVDPRLPRRDHRQRPGRAVQRRGAEGGAVHPAGQPEGRAAACSCTTPPATWWARTTSRAGSSSTARR